MHILKHDLILILNNLFLKPWSDAVFAVAKSAPPLKLANMHNKNMVGATNKQ
jgi:hypothetical protein